MKYSFHLKSRDLAAKANKADLLNPYKTSLLRWGDYADGTCTLESSIIGRSIRISVGSCGKLSGTWFSSQVKDTRSIIIPDGIINIDILSVNQVQITGTTAEYRVREIMAM